MQASIEAAADDAILARDSARTFSLLCFTVNLITTLGWHFIKGESPWQWPFALSATAILCGLVWLGRPRRSLGLSLTVFLGCAAVSLFSSALSTSQLAHSGLRFEAFNGYKLVAMAVAIIAPLPVWMGYAIIATCAVAPIAQYYALEPAVRAAFAVQEPWYTMVFAVIAFYVFRFRVKSKKQERTLTMLRAEQQALREQAKVFIALRDLTNTPLQSIELATCLLESDKLSREEAVQYLRVSLSRLRELNEVLVRHEHDVDWSTTKESFDAVALLRQTLARLPTD